MSVSEWADKKRILTPEETARPGPWRTSQVPYLKDIMDAASNDDIQTIVLLKPTQTGGTEIAINTVGYIIDQNPSRILYVLPDDTTAKEFSDMRMQKVLRNCDCFQDKFLDADSKDSMLKFRGGFLKMAGAQSPAKLASWPVKVVIMDEIDKYPMWSGKEASPLKLAEERTKTYINKKIFLLSTPTLKTGHIYQAYLNADVRYKFHVPCPHCGHMQQLLWKQVKFDKHQDITLIETNAYYECCHCHKSIYDKHKPDMLAKGKWVAENSVEGKAKNIAFALNSIYSPWITFGQVAAEFMRSKDDPKNLMNFVNSWLGEPWENKAANMEIDMVMQQRTNLPMNMVPDWAQILTGGVDCQQGYFYWNIRAWGPRMTSQLVAYGRALSFEDIETCMDKFWPDESGELRWQVMLYSVDSGYDTENVYQFCAEHQGLAIPVKGSSNQMIAPYKISQLEKKEKGLMPQLLYTVDTDQYKNMIAARLSKPKGQGAWMLNADTELEYAEQITSEHKIITEKNGHQVDTWVKKTSAKQNHWWDCEVYNAVAADLLHVRNLEDAPPPVPSPQIKLQPDDDGGYELPEPEFNI